MPSTIFITALTGGLAGAFAAHWLVVWRECAGRRLVFRNIIHTLLVELRDTEGDGSDFYASSRRTVLVECAKVSADIVHWRSRRFKAACTAYSDLGKKEDERGVQDFMHTLLPTHPEYGPPKTVQPFRHRMIVELQALIDSANYRAALDAAVPLLLHTVHQLRRASERGRYRDMKLHSTLFGWRDPDQALRVAAGIQGKRASVGRRPGGRYCQRCEAFLTMYRTWEPQSGVGLELEDMVKTN